MAPRKSSAIPTFACTICLEDKRSNPSASINIAGNDIICQECYTAEIKPMFSAALRNQNQYPVRWGDTMLDPKDLPGFSATFQAQWREKMEEYAVLPATDRLYCQQSILLDGQSALTARQLERFNPEMVRRCGNFLGKKAVDAETVVCMRCRGKSCGSCGVALKRSSAHTCNRTQTDDASKEPDAFEGLIRGNDWQICPTCSLRVTLRDGCNTLVCVRCLTHYCYLCGLQAHHDSDHWRNGSACPRWGRPGSGLHDPPAAANGGDVGPVADPGVGAAAIAMPDLVWFQLTAAAPPEMLFDILDPAMAPVLQQQAEEKEHARAVLLQAANLELDPQRRYVRQQQARILVPLLRSNRNLHHLLTHREAAQLIHLGTEALRHIALKVLVNLSQANLEWYKAIQAGDDVPDAVLVLLRNNHGRIVQFTAEFPAAALGRYPELTEVYEEYMTWAEGAFGAR